MSRLPVNVLSSKYEIKPKPDGDAGETEAQMKPQTSWTIKTAEGMVTTKWVRVTF